GPHHQHLRRLLRPAYSRQTAARHLPRLAEAVEALVRGLPPGQPMSVQRLMQRLVSEQVVLALLGRGVAEVFDDAVVFSGNLLSAVAGYFLALRGRGYRAAKATMWAAARDILEERRALGKAATAGRDPRIADLVLGACDVDGRPFSENDLIANVLLRYLAGIDTAANTAAFLTYQLLRQPPLLERVVAEVDESF